MKKYEYDVEIVFGTDVEDKMNQKGQEGWRVVDVTYFPDRIQVVYERLLEGEACE
jgi:hypothetical protein